MDSLFGSGFAAAAEQSAHALAGLSEVEHAQLIALMQHVITRMQRG